MEYNSNTKEVQARLALIRANIAAGVFSDALVAGLNAGMGIMMRRIFNQSLDAEGNSLGPYYSEQYERDRVRKGRQIAKKDLQFTGTLKASIQIVTVNNTKAEIRITNDETATIARKQENQIYNLRNGLAYDADSGGKVPIFEFSPNEFDITETNTRELLKQKLTF